jgi:hypothetical protein
VYIYKSPVGLMVIHYDKSTNKWVLTINETYTDGYYDSPVAAADNVYMHVTGYFEWDILDCKVDSPAGIDEWTKTNTK